MRARDNVCPICTGRILGHKMPTDLIVEKLAKQDAPVFFDGVNHVCTLCRVGVPLVSLAREPFQHAPTCPWRMAVELFPQPVPIPDPEDSLPRCGWN